MIDAMKQTAEALEEALPVISAYMNTLGMTDVWKRLCVVTDNLRAAIEQAEKQVVVFKLVNGEICYLSEEDDQSYRMWCPVTPDYKAPFPEGATFYTTPVPQIPAGMVLVPKEPTEAMYATVDNERLAQMYWRKLIAAAPKG